MAGSTYTAQDGRCTSKADVSTLAARQFGRVTWAQLRALGVSEGAIRRWTQTGYLFNVLPRVYAVGHRTPDESARLFSLLLFAGPGAALSHGTSAHRRGWLRYPVDATHVSTPRRIRTKLPGVVFHCERKLEREGIEGVPCTTTTQTLLDLAATESERLVNRALAQLDYTRALDAKAVRGICKTGRPGSAALRRALSAYMPQLAHTKSELEDEFLYLCRRAGLPLPQVNARVFGEEVDCYWPNRSLVVELDGGGNHSTAAQRNRDQRKALRLRAHGIELIRYTWNQVYRYPNESIRDLTAQVNRCGSNMLS